MRKGILYPWHTTGSRYTARGVLSAFVFVYYSIIVEVLNFQKQREVTPLICSCPPPAIPVGDTRAKVRRIFWDCKKSFWRGEKKMVRARTKCLNDKFFVGLLYLFDQPSEICIRDIIHFAFVVNR